MNSEIKSFTYDNGDLQRVQLVRPDSFDALDFFRPAPSADAFEKLVALYRDFIVPKAPFIFGKFVLYRVPEDFPEELLPAKESDFGTLYTPEARVKAAFLRDVSWKHGAPYIQSLETLNIWKELSARGCLDVVCGNRNYMGFLPVGNTLGLLSETAPDAALKVNSSFFVMDCFDCGTIYDTIGTPLGLCVKNGEILNPPLFDREVLLTRNGKCSIENVPLTALEIEINGRTYRHAQDGVRFYMRPESKKTPLGGVDLVIVGKSVVAVKKGGKTLIPCSGFVIHCKNDPGIFERASVSYHGLEDLSFAIQVGNSAVRDGKKTEGFISRFYNIKKLGSTAYPPSLYPLNYQKSRAPRIVLGADAADRPMLLWFEGAAKFGYVPGEGSCGASLSELADICEALGMQNGVNLDGGGSAEILLNNARALQVSDRNPEDFSENERAVPMGLIIR